ncbi:MAG: ABC transporter substrate-binding protein [Campylobacterota bacterium]|nr:ABC transporter substrate-binding protein [Campylobacterota bacterium]
MKNKNYVYIILLIATTLILFQFSNKETKKGQKIYNVAFVSLSNVDDNTFDGFKEKMEKYGWIENRNINYILPGPAQSIDNLPLIVSKVVSNTPDLILVSSTPATQAVKEATAGTDIAVVFCPVNDPVSSKIVDNPNAPSGNITGIRLPIGDSKRFEWLYKIVPDLKNVLIPYTPNDGSSQASRDNVREIAKKLNINIIEKPFDEEIKSKDQFSDYLKDIDAVFLPRDSKVEANIDYFVTSTNDKKLPLCVPSYQQVQKGALFTYGFIHKELGTQAARMADRILRGVNPSDLPVKFGNSYLVINEVTAKTIGIKLNDEILRNTKMTIK